MNQTKVYEIFQHVVIEMIRAEDKHGNQNHLPSLDKTLLKRKGSCSAERMCEHYEVPSEVRAKFLCDNSFKNKEVTHAHILVEEISEAISCLKDEKKMRDELIQVIGVATNWIIAIDAKHKKQ